MTGSKTNAMTRDEVLAALRNLPPKQDFVWDGSDEDERPATQGELHSGGEADQRRRGRPSGSTNISTTIRFDHAVLEAFRATGAGWQSRINEEGATLVGAAPATRRGLAVGAASGESRRRLQGRRR